MSYKVEIKQLLKFRHCRIYRSFIRDLMRDMNLKTKVTSYLFFYIILCSYANFRTSYIRIESNYFTVYPGHWVCRLSEITEWFRLKTRKQTVEEGATSGKPDPFILCRDSKMHRE